MLYIDFTYKLWYHNHQNDLSRHPRGATKHSARHPPIRPFGGRLPHLRSYHPLGDGNDCPHDLGLRPRPHLGRGLRRPQRHQGLAQGGE